MKLVVALALFFLGLLTLANAAPPTGSITRDVTATVGGIQRTLTLTISRFEESNGQLFAIGTLALPENPQSVTAVRLPVDLDETTGSCEILNLVLGPLDLNLLGLEVHLDQVVLNITAQPGPGNLLGNLLCAVANLLNTPSPAQSIASLLRQILRALG